MASNTTIVGGAVLLLVLILASGLATESYQYPRQSSNIRLRKNIRGEKHSFRNDAIDNPVRFGNNGNLLLYIPVDPNLLQLAGTGRDY